jgi:DNA-directed RNA polymerase specialized sigma24 family protein
VLEQLVRKERREAVQHAVHNLAAPQRRVALMRMQGHSVKQMAEALGCTTYAVDYHMRGAKFHLARALANV